MKVSIGNNMFFQNFTVLFCLYIGYVNGQSIGAVKNSYQQSLAKCIVLKNNTNIIPLLELDKVKPLYIQFRYNSPLLYERLRKYQRIPTMEFQSFVQNLHDLNTNLLFVDIDLQKTDLHDLMVLSAEIERSKLKYILCLSHVLPVSFPGHIFPHASAILVSVGESAYHALHIAQIIYGAESSVGKLPFKLNNKYSSGAGILTASLNRIKYGPPELVNVSSQEFETALDRDAEDAVRKKVFPGVNLLVAKDGIVIYHKAFGKIKFDAPDQLSEHHIYDLASITKIFAATLGSMKLHSEGRFDPNATLGRYWPYLNKSNKSTLIWKEVLAHRGRLVASIAYYRKILNPNNTYKKHSVHTKLHGAFNNPISDSLFANRKISKRVVHEVKKTALLPEPKYVYSDLSMILLGKTIEQITKISLDEYSKKNFYAPLGATETTFLPLHFFPKKQIVPTEKDSIFRKDLVHGYVHDENAALLGGVSGHAGLFSNANDMAKIAQMLLNKGEYGGKKYISSETIKSYTQYQYADEGNRRGLGFDKPLLNYDVNQAHTARDASNESYGHSGFTGTFIWIDPKYNLTYILLSNRVYPTRANNKISQLSIRPCIQQTVYDYILK